MNDDIDKPDDEQTEAKPRGPTGGERLAEARRAQQISVLEIAKELHLDEPKVRALEKNEFDALGAPVFAKGHLRKYARIVGVDNDDVLADYYRLTRSHTMPPVVTHWRKPRREFSPGPWIAAIIVLIGAAIAYWLLATQPLAPLEAGEDDPAAGTQTPAVVDGSADHAVDNGGPLAAEEPMPEPEVQQVSPAADVASDAPVAATTDGEVRLSVTFLGDCWTEISDATGRRLFFELGRTGRTISVSGQAPLSVLFGNADNVSLQVDGEDFAISDADAERRGRTARFMLHGS